MTVDAGPVSRVGIVGSGDIGATVARLCVAAGVEVAIANSRGPASLEDLVGELGPLARAVTVREAAAFGELVLVAIPFGAYPGLPEDAFDGRIVVDACNYFAERDGDEPELQSGALASSTQLLGRRLRGARMVKALNTLNYLALAARADRDLPRDERLAVLVASDDAAAKDVVSRWLEAIGLGPVDSGALADRFQEPGSHVFNRPMTVRRAVAALGEDRWTLTIGIVGSGDIGATVARLCVDAGLEVAIANSRGPDSLGDLVADLGPLAHAATVREAAAFGDLILVAVPFGAYRDLPRDAFDGRIVVDAANYFPARDGEFPALAAGEVETSTELLAHLLDGPRVIKALNTVNFRVLADEADRDAPADDRLAILVSSDDLAAKRLVIRWLGEIGLGPIDAGPLREGGRRQEPGSPLFNRPASVAQTAADLAALAAHAG